MYPNLYYVFSDLFGVEIHFFKLINSFGFFVAMAFLSAGYFLKKEIKRKTQNGVFSPTHGEELVGAPATISGILGQALIGFVFGWKFLYLAINAGDLFEAKILPQTLLASLRPKVPLQRASSPQALFQSDRRPNPIPFQ